MEDVNYKITEKIHKKGDEFNYKTLVHYFLLDDEIYRKSSDQRRVEERITEIEPFNKNKQNILEVKSEPQNIKVFDVKTNSIRYIVWSGANVLYNVEENEYREKWNRYIGSIVYYSNAFTYLNTFIIVFAIVEICTPITETDELIGSKKSVLSQLSFLRVFRIFRVIRLTKALRRFKSTTLLFVFYLCLF